MRAAIRDDMISGMKANPIKHICLLFKYNNRADRERLFGIRRFAASRPDWDVRTLDRSSPSFAAEAAQLRHGWTVDGIIYSVNPGVESALKSLSVRQAFKVAMDPPENAPAPDADVCVRADIRKIGKNVISWMKLRGYRNFGFYGTTTLDDGPYSDMCERHLMQALASDDWPLAVFRESGSDTWTQRLKAAARWVANLPKPCVILAYSDELSKNLLDACRVAHINVPEQISILGLDDAVDICETSRPTLSSIRLDFEMSGYLAARSLNRAMRKGGHDPCRTVTYGIQTITERQSTQDVRGSGRLVNAAMDLIRTLPLDTLSASAVIEKLHASRRLVEMNFKKVLGHGIHAQILQRRLATLHDRLVKTNIPIGELALDCGFKTSSAARAAYRKRYGISMRAQRGG